MSVKQEVCTEVSQSAADWTLGHKKNHVDTVDVTCCVSAQVRRFSVTAAPSDLKIGRTQSVTHQR